MPPASSAPRFTISREQRSIMTLIQTFSLMEKETLFHRNSLVVIRTRWKAEFLVPWPGAGPPPRSTISREQRSIMTLILTFSLMEKELLFHRNSLVVIRTR